ncbi:hypothetical protein ANO11243_056960 [Dothideomycetidae sp. 11243]|nr:hypothetical protein ANO11243_056960 [fungal sp. No.11243]
MDDDARFQEAIMTDMIRAEHADFLDGMRKYYETLVLMGYFESDGIAWNAEPNEHLHRLGYSSEAIALINSLPYPKQSYLETIPDPPYGVHVALIPASGPVCYTDETSGAKSARTIVGDAVLPPPAVKITHMGADEGEDYVYDMPTRSLIRWDDYDDDDCMERYDDQPREPAGQLLSRWIENLETMTWIPWVTNGWHTVDATYPEPEVVAALEKERDTCRRKGRALPALKPGAYDRAWVNNHYSRRLILEQCGWPDQDKFQRDKFLQMREEWHARQLDVLRRDRAAAGQEVDEDSERDIGYEYMNEGNEGLRRFLRESAGHYAV